MPVDWTDRHAVLRALGPSSGAAGDAYLDDVVAAANARAYTMRAAAGYIDPADGPAPSADVALGATMLAVGLYRERGSADTYASFDELGAGYVPTGAGYGQVRRLLGIGRGRVDTVPTVPVVGPLRRRR